jgi:acyl-CoA synthetase (NDP forming)
MPDMALKAFFEPSSVAVIGASANPAKLAFMGRFF